MMMAIYRRTLCNVWFGIALMVLTGLYIAVGSGLPGVRAYFEMNDLAFFNAWPLRVLMVLLVSTLATITWTRIPFTPPRYGVWMVHVGIVVLIYGMFLYYSFKVEGLTLVPMGQTATHFYLNNERALYMRVSNAPMQTEDLPSLPRYHAYAPRLGNEGSLAAKDLKGITPIVSMRDEKTGRLIPKPLNAALGLPELVKVDVVEYWPYAKVVSSPLVEPGVESVGVKLQWEEPAEQGSQDGGKLVDGQMAGGEAAGGGKGREKASENAGENTGENGGGSAAKDEGQAGAAGGGSREAMVAGGGSGAGGKLKTHWLVAGEDGQSGAFINDNEVEVRQVTAEERKQIIGALEHMHTLTVNVGDEKQVLHVSPGRSYEVGKTGYTLTVESFDPAFPAMNKEVVPLLTVMVKSPGQEFRRQLIPGRDKPTDWKLGVAGAGPLGARQSAPLDETLKVDYAFSDPMQLVPRDGLTRQVILAEGQGLTLLGSALSSPPTVTEFADGKGQVELADHEGRKQTIHFTYQAGVHIVHRIVPVPMEQRERDEAGLNQVVMVRVSMGDWSEELPVTYRQFAMEQPWDDVSVKLHGTPYRLQFALGNASQFLPAQVTLEKFELVNYPGGSVNNTDLFRDFQSHIRVDELDENDMQRVVSSREAVAKLNSPVYFGGFGDSYWTLFQAQWDREQRFTVLGVGNRPGVWVMLGGSILMAVGLLWAFYLKPVLVARMKARALVEAAGRQKVDRRK